MGNPNSIWVDSRCPFCGTEVQRRELQANIDRHGANMEYQVGDKTDWFGCAPRGGTRAFFGWPQAECEVCGRDWFVFFVVYRGVILEPIDHPIMAGYICEEPIGPKKWNREFSELMLTTGLERIIEALDGSLSGVMAWRSGDLLELAFSRVHGFQGIGNCSVGLGDGDGIVKSLSYAFEMLARDKWEGEIEGGQLMGSDEFKDTFYYYGGSDWVRDVRHVGIWFDRSSGAYSYCLHEAAARCHDGPIIENQVHVSGDLAVVAERLLDFLGS